MFKTGLPTHSLIYGVGVDILDLNRIAKVLDRFPKLFPLKILTPLELVNYPSLRTKQINYLGKRFAAKEAFAKALGTGFGRSLHFSDISVTKNERGQPSLYFSPRLRHLYPYLNPFLSLADELPTVIAFCILYDTHASLAIEGEALQH